LSILAAGHAREAELKNPVRILVLTDKDLVAATKNGPDVLARWRILRENGFDGEISPAASFPRNPFGAKATALRGLDPLRTIALLWTQRKYQIIVCAFEASAVGPAILKRLGLLRRPLLIWDYSAGTTWRLKQLFQKISLPAADGILCLNQGQIRTAEEEFGAAGKAIFVGYDVDAEFFRPVSADEGDYVLSVGSDVSRDYELLLEAIQPLPLNLTICSRRSIEIPKSSSATITRIDRYLSYAELRDLYAGAKFVVLALKDMVHPGGITTLVEAMSMGKAIICSDSTGLRELLQSGENAVVVPPGDCAALRNAIGRLDADPSERRRLGKNARRYAEYEFASPAAAKRLGDAFRKFA
jgi:glycosyltransferase involved in cell wall biosynthesis